MGILKIGQQGVGSFCKQTPTFNGKDLKMEKSIVPGSGVDCDDDDFDDIVLSEMSCELGMVEGQLCNIPYELYDLPNLREILSMETWNSCLTEEERFSLSAYLPDMDQHTFCLTMKELLGGSDMHFGNPLDMFFKRLKGGFYPPKVASFRECLQFLQRRKYYHSLVSYHDNMVQTFKDMSSLWNQCGISIGVEERVHMWRTRSKNRGNNLFDLNTVPEDGDLLDEDAISPAVLHHLSKKNKSVPSKRGNNNVSSLSPGGMKFVTPKCKAKGVLKLNASWSGSLQHHTPKVTANEPKGLLKIVPKVPLIQLEHSNVVLRQPQPTLLGSSTGLVDCKISSMPASVYLRNTSALGESPFFRQIVGNGEINTTLEEPHCVLNQQESTLRTGRYSKSYTSKRKIKREMNSSLDDIADLGKHNLFRSIMGRSPNVEYEYDTLMDANRYGVGSKNLWQNLGMGSKGISLTPFPFNMKCYEGEPLRKPMQEEHTTDHPSISVVGIGMQERQTISSSDQMRGQSDSNVKESEKLFGKTSVLEGFKGEPVFPLTYKRRKAQVKHNSFEFGKPLTAGADLNSTRSK